MFIIFEKFVGAYPHKKIITFPNYFNGLCVQQYSKYNMTGYRN